jgi:hypothetical protein
MGQNLLPSTARVGLNLDATTSQIQSGELTFALNGTIAGFDGRQVTYQNEQGTELCAPLPEGYSAVGNPHAIIEKNLIVFFLYNTTSKQSEIGVVDILNCSYTTKINNTCLNFNMDFPIKKAVHKITACGTEIYWTDNYNGRRYVNLDSLPFIERIENCDTNSTTEIDCNKLNIQPNFLIPQIDYEKIDSEGELIAGSYQFAVQYANALGEPYTSFYSITNPLPIADPLRVTLNFDYATGAAIQLQISNIDTSGIFDYYNLAAIRTTNNITSVELVGTYQIERATQQVTYTGQNKTQIKLTADDIFEKFAAYDKADDVTAVQDILIWSGLTTEERISWQKIANQITVQWETYKVTPGTKQYKNPIIAAEQRGYFRDEVYAFEIVPLYTNGYQADGFHIPGRVAKPVDLEIVQNPDSVLSTDICDPNLGGLPRWKVYNTATFLGYNPTGDDACYDGPYQYGEMGYWESEETYPCNEPVWGPLQGQPIRHHKMPDNALINHFNSDGNVFPLGIRIDLDQINSLILQSPDLSDAQKAKIAGFKIVRGNRANNKSVVAKGILYNVGKYTKEGNTYFYPNYPYNDLRPDPFIGAASNTPIQVSLSSNVTTTTTVGDTPTTLDITNIQYINVYHGTAITYSGVFQGAVGNRRIQVLFNRHDPTLNIPPDYVPFFDSGTFQAGSGTSWTLTLSTLYAKNVEVSGPGGGEYWDIATTGTLSLFGSTNKQINDHQQVPIGQNADLTGAFTLIGTGVNDGDIRVDSGALTGTSTISPTVDQLTGFGDDDSKKRFTFHSPDTSFYQPVLGDMLKLDEVIYGQANSHYVEVKNHSRYKFPTLGSYLTALGVGVVVGFASGLYGTSDQPFDGAAAFTTIQFINDIIYKLIPRKNFAYQFNSVGNYTNFIPVANDQGIKNRLIDIAAYAIPGYVGTGDTFELNNWERESSVFIRTTATVPFPSDPSVYPSAPQDVSRVTMSQNRTCQTPNSIFTSLISSYYGGIKRANLNQYGQIYSYTTIDTGFQFLIGAKGVATVFGGDCFINKFSFKRKLPFFIDNRVGQPDDSDVFYDTLGNVGFPTYWFSTDIQKGSGGNFNVGELFGVKVNNFDCEGNNFFYESGKIYLFAYGIPTFFCESEVNVDYRQAYNDREGEYYPHVSQGIPDDWLQEIRVSINNDNTYVYNKSFSKQNAENTFTHLPVDFVPNQECVEVLPNRSVYSDKQFDVINYNRNNWRIYRPASMYDFPLNYGNLISLEGIENRVIIARFENKSQIYNSLITIDTSVAKAAYLGNANMFTGAPPIDYDEGETDIGYNGTQHKMFLKTEFGNVSVDAKRGNIYMLNGNRATDITSKGMNMFFSDNLPFQMRKAFPNYDIDNIWKGVGLTGVYESKFKRVIITKLDYKPIYPETTYDKTTDTFTYKGKTVQLWDRQYFCNVSWTISYSFLTQSWVSFHTYLPNYYVANADFFFSGVNPEAKLWRHNTNLIEYNKYYDLTQPYIIEYPFSYKINTEVVQSIKDYSKIIRQIDSQSFVETDDIYFNKCIVYNDQQSTGMRNLVRKIPGNMPQALQYPKYNTDSIDILWTKSDNCYNFNGIWDVTNLQNLPLFVRSCVALSYDKIVNQNNMVYKNQPFRKPSIRAKDSKVRLILDNRSDVRVVSEFIIQETQTSIK